MFEPPMSELFEHVESFGGRFVEMLTLSNFFKNPRFDDRAAGNHGGVYTGFLYRIVKVNIRVHVSVSNISPLIW